MFGRGRAFAQGRAARLGGFTTGTDKMFPILCVGNAEFTFTFHDVSLGVGPFKRIGTPTTVIFQLTYTCAMRADVDSSDLDEIAKHTRHWSLNKDLTGISICKDCSALQVLEGDEQVVMDLFKLISDDPRVINPLVLLKRMSARREFLNWSTVYENASAGAASFELTTNTLPKVMPDELSPEINTIYRTFARVTGMDLASKPTATRDAH